MGKQTTVGTTGAVDFGYVERSKATLAAVGDVLRENHGSAYLDCAQFTAAVVDRLAATAYRRALEYGDDAARDEWIGERKLHDAVSDVVDSRPTWNVDALWPGDPVQIRLPSCVRSEYGACGVWDGGGAWTITRTRVLVNVDRRQVLWGWRVQQTWLS